MRVKILVGALLVSMAVCSQGYSFEILERLLGLGGDGNCGACCAVWNLCPRLQSQVLPRAVLCARVRPILLCQTVLRSRVRTSVLRPGLCQAVLCTALLCAGLRKPCCAPATCGCEGECGCKARCTPVRDLLANIKVRLCCDTCCGDEGCGSAGCCEKSCCEPKCHKLYRRPVVELLDKFFHGEECCEGCGCACAESGCSHCENCMESGHSTISPAPTPVPAPAPMLKKTASSIPEAPSPIPQPAE